MRKEHHTRLVFSFICALGLISQPVDAITFNWNSPNTMSVQRESGGLFGLRGAPLTGSEQEIMGSGFALNPLIPNRASANNPPIIREFQTRLRAGSGNSLPAVPRGVNPGGAPFAGRDNSRTTSPNDFIFTRFSARFVDAREGPVDPNSDSCYLGCNDSIKSDASDISPIPIPAAGILLITALGGLGGLAAHRRRRKVD